MKLKDINLAIIGAGRWGMNHVKTALSILDSNQIIVCDANPLIREKLWSINKDLKFTTRVYDIASNKDINAVIISTPAETHYLTAFEILKSKKNVLVEKPLTLLPSAARALIKIAKLNSCKLMVGHVLLYHPAIIVMKELINSGMIGKLQYIYSNRLNLGAIRKEENILWSFAPHDISILQYLTGIYPTKITAKGATFLQDQIEDTTLTYLEYPQNVRAHIFVSWLNPFKEQRLVVIGEKGMFVFEDTLPKEKLKFYTKGFENNNGKMCKFDNGTTVIEHADKMPLAEEQLHFYDCILNDKEPLTNGEHALEVLEILQAATSQLKTDRMIPKLEQIETHDQIIADKLFKNKSSATV